MNRLSTKTQQDIAAHIVEGNSLRSISRLLDITYNTVARNVLWIGEGLLEFHHQHVRELRPRLVQADELWSIIYGKDKNLPPALQGSRDFGDMYTWVALDPEARLFISWHVGKREFADAQIFATDLASRIVSRVQITTDQLSHYRTALFEAFGDGADYATLRKATGDAGKTPDGRFERPENLKIHRKASVFGKPDTELISTSSIESYNLQLRMSSKRYQRFTNAFSKKIEPKRATLTINFCYHNFCRRCPPIRVSPAMEAGLTDHIWTIEELLRHVPERPTRWTGHVAAYKQKLKPGGTQQG